MPGVPDDKSRQMVRSSIFIQHGAVLIQYCHDNMNHFIFQFDHPPSIVSDTRPSSPHKNFLSNGLGTLSSSTTGLRRTVLTAGGVYCPLVSILTTSSRKCCSPVRKGMSPPFRKWIIEFTKARTKWAEKGQFFIDFWTYKSLLQGQCCFITSLYMMLIFRIHFPTLSICSQRKSILS